MADPNYLLRAIIECLSFDEWHKARDIVDEVSRKIEKPVTVKKIGQVIGSKYKYCGIQRRRVNVAVTLYEYRIDPFFRDRLIALGYIE